jgi:Mrp family chromosome partitioning ATPase
MSKIFEALEHARRESDAYHEPADDDFITEPGTEFIEPEADVQVEPLELDDILNLHREPVQLEAEAVDDIVEEPVARESRAPTSYRFDVEDAILALYQRVDTLLPLSNRRIIQFIGPEGEEDVSSIARGFAYVAVKAGKSVLLIEGDQKNHNQKRFFKIKNSVSWMNALYNDTVKPDAIHKIGDIPLYISANSDGRQRSQQVSLPKAFESFVRDVGQDFDLMVVDSSPVQKTNDGLMLSPLMDGIVLVVEANKTMSNAAEEIKNRILRSGGNLLGVVVSRERHYLPSILARYMAPKFWK